MDKKKRILVCDDIPRMRDIYKRALSNIENVDIETIDHPQYVMDTLRSRRFSVLLMDLEFPIEPGSKRMGIIGHTYLPQIRKTFPWLKIVVVTQLGPKVYPVVLACDRERLHDAWIDVGKEVKGEEITARVQSLVYPLGMVSREGLWLVQMSDLHFGKSTEFSYWGSAEDGPLLDALKNDITETIPKEFPEFNRKPDLIVVIGDITHNARDEEYDKFETFIRRLTAALRGLEDAEGTDRLVIVPGNHDVNFDISRARSVVVEKEVPRLISLDKKEDIPSELRYLRKYMWAPFERFIKRLPLALPTFDELWTKDNYFGGAAWAFPELGSLIFCVNTAATGIDHFTNKPTVDTNITTSLENSLEHFGASELIMPRLLLAHHSLGSSTTGSERVNDEEIAALRKAFSKKLDIRIFLTGHVHQEIAERVEVEGKSLLFVGAGSTAAKRDERGEHNPLHYNLINIHPHGETDDSPDRVAIYSRIFLSDEFAKNPKNPKLVYSWNDTAGWIREEVHVAAI